MTIDLAAIDYLPQLEQTGMRPNEKLVQRILKLGPALIQPLLELATNLDMLYEGPPRAYAPIHALRLLGELGDPIVIEPLLHAYPMDDMSSSEGNPAEVWDADLPQIVGHFGTAAEAPLWAILDDPEQDNDQRYVAVSALAYATACDAELRERTIARLHSRLTSSDNPTHAAQYLIGLANIGVAEIYPEVMALYKAGKIDRAVIEPATARQLLLTKGHKRLACVNHPLWERYDQHGPYPLRD